jgi:hypothetical protein
VEKLIGLTEIFSPAEVSDRAHFFYPDCFTIIVRLAYNSVVGCHRASFFCAGGTGLSQLFAARWWKSSFLDIISEAQTKTQSLPQRHQGTVNKIHFFSFF